jgi:hypothetical protein
MRFTGSALPDTSRAQSRYFIWDETHKWCDCFGLIHKGKMVHAVDCQSVEYELSNRRAAARREAWGLPSDPRDDEDDPDHGEEHHRLGLYDPWDDVFSPMDWGDN